MQLEWNKWLTGMQAFKEGQGMLWIFCLAVFLILWKKLDKKQQRLFGFAAIMGILIICPLTAVVLLKGYTPFYDWMDLQLLVPITLLLAVGAVEIIGLLEKMTIPGLHLKGIAKNTISLLCVVVLLFAGATFHGFDKRQEADVTGVPVEVAEVLDPIHRMVADKPVVLAAPSSILLYTRLYEVNWQPLYGRDLWSAKAASYINSGYNVEYEFYELLEKEQLSEEEFKQLSDLILEGPANCVIVPAYWIADMEQLNDWMLVNLNGSYTGIIKKDLVTE